MPLKVPEYYINNNSRQPLLNTRINILHYFMLLFNWILAEFP